MATCFVYIRKSTNSPEKQKNSLDYQTDWANEVLKEHLDLDVIGLDGRVCEIPQDGFIVESVSAKEESSNRRSGFQNMMLAIEEYGVDYVVCCYVSRISRNEKDARVFMDAIKVGNGKIRLGVITEGRTYLSSSSRDMIDLDTALFKAKQENAETSITSTNYHKFKKRRGIFTSAFPFGYEAVRKDAAVSINTEKAQLIRLAYEWRLNGCQWTEIAKEFAKKGYKKTGGNIKTAVLNPIQYGEFEFNGEMCPVKNPGYMPIIDKPTYDKLVEYEKIHGGKHSRTSPIASKGSKKFLDKMVYDVAGQMLQGAITKEKTYYRQRNKDFTYKISIAESKLFREAGNQIHKFSPPASFSLLIEAQLKEKLALSIKEEEREIHTLEGEIKALKAKIDGWLDQIGNTSQQKLIEMYEGKIIETTEKVEQMEKTLASLKSAKKDINGIAKKYANLFADLPGTYKKVSKEEKAAILRGLGVSFIVGPDANITLIGGKFQQLFISNQFMKGKNNEP